MMTRGATTWLRNMISLSPSYPVLLILFGLIFALAIVSSLGIQWHAGITITLYVVTFAWTVLLTWARRWYDPPWSMIDLLLVSFLLIVLASTLLHGREANLITGYQRYLPFLLVSPYLCGRLMTRHDIDLFTRLVVYVGIIMVMASLWYAYTSPVDVGRQILFGVNHMPLLVGGVVAVSVLAIGAYGILDADSDRKSWMWAWRYAWMGMGSCFLVWISARGWVVSVLVGFLMLVLGGLWNRPLAMIYLRRMLFVIATMLLTLLSVPQLDKFYGGLQFSGSMPSDGYSESGPILGFASCDPVVEGVNSVAIRWLLYQEAMAQFLEAPLAGSGAGLFGERSCLGVGGYPHSTVFQSFSELGVVGGIVYLALIAIAMVSLLRLIAREQSLARHAHLLLVLSLFVMFFLADQIYGNYFMASGTYFTLGVIAALKKRFGHGDPKGVPTHQVRRVAR